MLENAGSVCSVVENGKAAVEVVLNDPTKFDCILMDCNMPVMDGWEATQEIQRVLGHKVPIVAVTANALKGDREKCLDAGMDSYITKPIKLSLLLDVVIQLINQNVPCTKVSVDADAEKSVTAITDTSSNHGKPNSKKSNLTWSSFSTYDPVRISTSSLEERKQLLMLAPPLQQPVDMVRRLD